MKKVQKRKFKKGAAAFYIVAMSAVVLVVLAVSFATVIISELTRTSNNDLAQSAYDSALAGVEDAKLAFANYRRCVENGAVPNLDPNGTVECGDIMYWMQPENQDCDMVARMIGRISDNPELTENDLKDGVLVSDTVTTDRGEISNNLQQAYTCVKMQTTLTDYRATLSDENRMRIIRPQFSDGVTASDITQVKFSWYTKRAGDVFFFNNFASVGTGYRTVFQPAGQIRTVIPPTMEIQMVQTGEWFSLDNLNGKSSGGSTDRATLYLVPAGGSIGDAVSGIQTAASDCTNNYYCGTYNGGSNGTNSISAAQVAATNDQVVNKPFVVYCGTGDDSEYACSVTINLPTPIEGSRSDETFVFLVTLPYGEPSTDFAMEFLCGASTPCGESRAHDDGSELTEADLITALDGVQIEIDSTGRANDVYRRVKTRLESSDESFPYPGYAVQLFGDGIDTIQKTMTVLREWNYYQ